MEVELFIVINMNIDCTRVTMLQMNSRTTGCNINGWETWIWTDFLHLIQWFILLTQEFFCNSLFGFNTCLNVSFCNSGGFPSTMSHDGIFVSSWVSKPWCRRLTEGMASILLRILKIQKCCNVFRSFSNCVNANILASAFPIIIFEKKLRRLPSRWAKQSIFSEDFKRFHWRTRQRDNSKCTTLVCFCFFNFDNQMAVCHCYISALQFCQYFMLACTSNPNNSYNLREKC